MRFVRDKELGRLINVAHVTQFRNTRAGVMANVGDETMMIAGDWWELIVSLEAEGVVPAQPGWEALWFGCERDQPSSEAWVNREPILAWRVCGFEARGVTTDPHAEPMTLKRPNGSVTDPHNQDWPSEDAWLEAMKRDHDEALHKRKGAAA
jgi:hypothetical protein